MGQRIEKLTEAWERSGTSWCCRVGLAGTALGLLGGAGFGLWGIILASPKAMTAGSYSFGFATLSVLILAWGSKKQLDKKLRNQQGAGPQSTENSPG